MRADLRLAGIAIGCWLSALAALHLSAGPGWLLALAGAVVALIAGSVRATVLATVALGVVCGATATAARIGERDEQPLAGLVHAHAPVRFRFAIGADPHEISGPQTTFLVAGRLVWLRPESGDRVELGARVLVLASNRAWAALLPGQVVEAAGRLAPSRGGDLSAGVVSVTAAPTWVGRPPLVQTAAGALRAGLQRACADLPPAPGGLLPGLVVGDTSHLDPALHDAFQSTGLTHLVAVSGANIAILAGLVLLLARWCRAGPRLSAVLCGLALVGFVILARPSPSVLRAAAMGALALIALAGGRPRSAVPALAAAVVVLVVFDPELAADAGFALSALATAGLMLLAPGWAEALRARGVPRGLAEALAVPAAAQAACMPVIAAISGTVSMTAIPANLLAEPAVAPATVLGVVAATLSPLWPAGAAFVAWLASWPARWLVTVAQHGATVPDGVLPWPGGPWGGLLMAVLLVALLFAFHRPVVRRLVLVAALAAVVGAVPVRIATGGWPPRGWLSVMCDVGQGDGIAISVGPHSAVVIDSGPDPQHIDGCLSRLGVDTVPLLVFTHYHEDHVGGLDGVLRERRVGRLLVSPFPQPLPAHAAVLKAAAAVHAPVELAVPGTVYTVGPLRLTVLGPVDRLTGTDSDPNNNSVVLRAAYGGHTLLLTGDAEDTEQRTLLEALGPAAFHADVLKVAHHGSARQDPGFLDAVGAGVGLISVGKNNDYGHPAPSLVSRLTRTGVRVLRTDQNGDLAVVDREGHLGVVARGSSP